MDTNVSKFPKFVEIQTYTKCNGYCTICPYKATEKLFPQKYMSMELIEKILDECSKHKNEITTMVPYVNNEPFLDKRLIEILKKIKETGLSVELSTNASLLSKEKSDEIIKHNLINDFRISFFASNKDEYEKCMTGVKFENAVKNIKYFAEENKKNGNPINTTIIMILQEKFDMQKNINEAKLLFNLPVRAFGYLDRAGANKEKNLLETAELSKNYYVSSCGTKRPNEWISIMADGNVQLCTQDWLRKYTLGNVQKTSIEEVWNCEKYNEIRNKIFGKKKTYDKNFICNKCKIANLSDETSETTNFKGDKYVTKDGKKNVIL